MGALVLGHNISGTITAILKIISDESTSDERTSGIYFFTTAVFILFLCLDSFLALPLNVRHRYFNMTYFSYLLN